ncbi:uncharacterized protein LOC119984641 isoform X2 [Tripterygium wilfordii]|uniref:uncharacterized protein LOC119984641 isoform X2 n=1 Tax=Tripterygium wilfordii TaxID=458696 RepID=UPI0018F8133E|nr:uncharacterized protein LOC119984641 isoform X2 [Tripterygium wilfordii]
MEGGGSSDMEFTDIETNADSLNSSVIFHVVKEVIGFVLFMHQQIPSILQDISLEFDMLHTEYKELVCYSWTEQNEVKASFRRKHNGRMREVKHGIRRLEKLMNTISGLQTAMQLMISEIPNIQGVMLILGASPVRPLHVYELSFLHGNVIAVSAGEFSKTRAAEGLSRKAIRMLISKGAGSGSYAGPTKLFLLVKAPSSFNLPLHFLPKRDFKYSKKIVPLRLRFKCKTQDMELDAPDQPTSTGTCISLVDCPSNDLIWFQCRHVIKGIAFKTPTEE